MTLIELHASKALQKETVAKHEAVKILRLSEDTFVTMDLTGHKLRRLVVRYGKNGFDLHESIIYQDFNAKIINVIGEVGKLYVMVDDRLEVKIKVLSFAESMNNLTV